MKKLFIFIFALALSFGIIGISNANLINNGGNLIYDTDLNITWYDFTYTGNECFGPGYWWMPETWYQAKQWAQGLTVGGQSGWTLPNAEVTGTWSDMEHLFFTELGLTQGTLISSSNQAPFTNILPSLYWTGTDVHTSLINSTVQAWVFEFSGWHWYEPKMNSNIYALAIHSGDIHPVATPIPAAIWLFGTGLVGLVAVRRKIKK